MAEPRCRCSVCGEITEIRQRYEGRVLVEWSGRRVWKKEYTPVTVCCASVDYEELTEEVDE